ncbi:hypothetical protein [Amycolatopsis sp. WGS_07]|uniref:hypothetical protein n=1 Tax=Amycolatopsis sp. WGS_07 TaxID=3076764 RepID=UPI003872F621
MDDFSLPPERPMPDILKESMWHRLVPQLHGRRRRRRGRPFVVAGAVGAFALSAVLVFATTTYDASPEMTVIPAGAAPSPLDGQRLKDCLASVRDMGLEPPDPRAWRPAIRVDETPSHSGYLVIRTSEAAGLCLLPSSTSIFVPGKSAQLAEYNQATLAGKQDGYPSLSPAHPVQDIGGGGNVRLGIARADVAAVFLIGPDGALFPAALRDGTYAVEIPDNVRVDNSLRVKVVLEDGSSMEVPSK